MKFIKNTLRKSSGILITLLLTIQMLPLDVHANDSWPFTGEAAHGKNQPSVKGYTSGQIMDWSPETEPHAEALRSRVPLQKRITPLQATQANPDLPTDIQMFNLAGDYGNAFIENAPYTNKFARYHFNYWQYIDYYSYWHGTATPYTPPEYYDDIAKSNWQEKWFEFGMLNIPDPTYTDAAHKNGVMSIATIFFSNNDRGQQTYKQMIVRDEDGNFPVAEKMIEMAEYFGYDGYFFNQEEMNPNVDPNDVDTYIEFMQRIVDAGLYVNWYDSLNTRTGANTFATEFNDNNISFLHHNGKQTSHSFFNDYRLSTNKVKAAKAYLEQFNEKNGTSYKFREAYFAGIEAGSDSVDGAHWAAGNQRAFTRNMENNIPIGSYAMLGADFVHSDLDRDMGLRGDSNPDYGHPKAYDYKHNNDYQWMTTVREQLWWSGPNRNPANVNTTSTNEAVDVYADTRNFKGVAQAIPEKSSIGGSNFFSSFNVGRGMRYYNEGKVVGEGEWSNMSLQDVALTWQWWVDTEGTPLSLDFDYGEGVKIDATRQNYTPIGAYNGGNSLVINGKVDAENLIKLYKTDLNVKSSTKLELAYNKVSNDGAELSVALIFKDNPSEVVKVSVPNTSEKTDGWVKTTLDLSEYAGKNIAVIGLNVDNNEETVEDYQMNIGQIRVFDGSAKKPSAPEGLKVKQALVNSNEMFIEWTLQDYETVKQYEIYVNDVMVGGKYDDIYYIKNLPAKSGVIKVVPIGADGLPGEAASVKFDISKAARDIVVDSKQDGTVAVSWENPENISGDTVVTIRNVNQLEDEPVKSEKTVSAGTTSVVFENMPINGDDYIVTVQIGKSDRVDHNGRFIDKVVKPYAEEFSVSGNRISLPMPNTRDWRYLYVYEDGVPRNFSTTYNAGSRPMIIRGRSTKDSLSFTSNAKTITVVMEDYTGNKSTPIYIKSSELTLEDFKDEQLYNWSIENIGDGEKVTSKDIGLYDGKLDLTGLDIKDYSDLKMFSNAKELIIDNDSALSVLDSDIFPDNVEVIRFTNSSVLKHIKPEAFKDLEKLRLLDISNNTNLISIDVSGTSVSEIVVDNVESLNNLKYINLKDSNIDFDHKSNWKFAKYFSQKLDKIEEGVSIPSYGLQSFKKQVESDMSSPNSITDGETGRNISSKMSVPAYATIDIGEEIELSSIQIYGYQYYPLKKFTLSYSVDGDDFKMLDEIENNGLVHYEGKYNQEKGRYFRIDILDGGGTRPMAYLAQVQVFGTRFEEVKSGVYYDAQAPEFKDLVAKLAEVSDLQRESYAPKGWHALQEAVEIAKTVSQDPYAIQSEIDGALDALNTAVDNLVEANFTVLTDVIEAAEAILSSGGLKNTIPAVVTEFNEALEAAKALYEVDTITQEAINTATTNLLAAIAKTEWKSGFKGSLEVLVELADRINLDLYVEKGQAEFKDALINAKAVLADENALEEEVEDVYTKLLDSVLALRLKVDKTYLGDLIKKAEEIDTNLYTKDSVEALNEALRKAQEVHKSSEATQESVEEVSTVLSNALENLVKKPTDSKEGILPGTGISNGMIWTAAGVSLLGVLMVIAGKRRKETD